MRSLTLRIIALAMLWSALFLPVHLGARTVSAHVHSVTPLNCTPANEDNGGGRALLETPAVENGGPIQNGPIPLSTGNAAFDPGTGGGNHGSPPGCQ